ncbi:MAG TPA: NDP-sugar synthase [Actinomycetota bacterium]|nr:NDP-sugar synthase [Actinomycetota bacterium]
MKALILAGGYGTRLRPLTYTRPKHMLPIANRPHIERVFDLLMSHGVKDVVLLTSYLSDAFADVIERAEAAGMTVKSTFEEEPLGTAGAFKNARDFVGDDAFVVFNGDILTDLDLTSVIEWHRSKGATATIVLHEVDDPSAYGVVETNGEGRVLGFIEKPAKGEAPTNLINAGIYVFEPSVLDWIPEGRVWSAERELFPQLVEDGAGLFALGTDAYWRDIGTPESYLEANLDAIGGRYGVSHLELESGDVVRAPDARAEGDASVRQSVLGPRVVVEAGAVVEQSVLLDGARVGRGATVRRSTLGAGVVVEPGATVEHTAVGDNESLPVRAPGVGTG